MQQFRTYRLLILLTLFAAVPTGWAQAPRDPATGTFRIDPLPAGAPVYRAGSKFQSSAPQQTVRTSAARTPGNTWKYSYDPSVPPIRQVSTAPGDRFIEDLPPEALHATPLSSYGQGSYFDGACDSCAPEALFSCCPQTQWSAGIEFAFLKPHLDGNPAFAIMQSDGATFETFTDTNFEYDRELAPRVWIEALQCESLGIRAVYWQFDYAARVASGSPPGNGFGRLSPPSFGAIDLSTTVPNSVFSAFSDLNAYSIDLEATKSFQAHSLNWMASAGLRYAEARQRYFGNLQNANGVPQGNVAYGNLVQGIGPTISVRTQRPFSPQLALFGLARGSLVFGDGKTELLAVENQDLNTSLTTRSSSIGDDLLPISEVQVGLQWMPPCPGIWHPYLHIALEGQHWAGAGNASSTEGDLGFFGFNVALGVDW